MYVCRPALTMRPPLGQSGAVGRADALVDRRAWWAVLLVVLVIASFVVRRARVGQGDGGGRAPLRIDVVSGVDCTGRRDVTATVQRALDALDGRTLVIPSGCVLRLASPGPGQASLTVPSAARIRCADASAGFAVARRRCVGGTYPDAACSDDRECLGGGTCAYDVGTSTYAPVADATYTILRDASAASTGVVLERCTIWTSQADPYQRCVGSAHAGDPCRQECDGGTLPGARCDVDADCPSGRCVRTEDCRAAGGDVGACVGAPGSPAGPGRIDPIDFRRTTRARVVDVTVFDHYRGDFAVAAAAGATIRDTHTARETTGCTSPLASPSDTVCRSAQAGRCCHGAAPNLASAASHLNTQPEGAVLEGIVVGADSRVVRSSARGTSWAIRAGDRAELDGVAAWPPSAAGPGTAGGGFQVGRDADVARSRAPYLNGGTCIRLGDGGRARGNACGGSAGSRMARGIVLGSGCVAADDRLEDVVGNGTAIDVAEGASAIRVTRNTIRIAEAGNQIGIHLAGNLGSVLDNVVMLPIAEQTPRAHQICILNQPAGFQQRIIGNACVGGWRHYSTGSSPDALTNTQVSLNRFVSMAGAPITAGGAGILIGENYFNAFGAARRTLVCDASCTKSRGAQCAQDEDCVGCDPRASRCIPEPAIGLLGSPSGTRPAGTAHVSWIGNPMYAAFSAVRQCAGATAYPGSLCETAGDACAADAACEGGPPATCQGGPEAGKACCAGAGARCIARTPTPFLRIPDPGVPNVHSDLVLSGNTLFGKDARDMIGLDMASLGNLAVATASIVDNTFSFRDAASSVGIRFPETGTFANVVVNGNNFSGVARDVVGWRPQYGALAFVPTSASMRDDLSVASSAFLDLADLGLPVAAGRTYAFRCEVTFSSSAPDNGIALAMRGPSDPVLLSYTATIPTRNSDTVTRGGEGDDATAAATTGVPDAARRYPARIEGTLVTRSTAGLLIPRARSAGVRGSTVTIHGGTHCVLTQMP